MQSVSDIELSVFVRNPQKFEGMDLSGVNIITGNALEFDDVMHAMDGQDVLLCSLEGDVLTMAKNIVAALAKTSVKRIIWITGMGIHHEIKGFHGIMLNQLAKKPYIKRFSGVEKAHRNSIKITVGFWWVFRDSNPGPTGYEPGALTN